MWKFGLPKCQQRLHSLSNRWEISSMVGKMLKETTTWRELFTLTEHIATVKRNKYAHRRSRKVLDIIQHKIKFFPFCLVTLAALSCRHNIIITRSHLMVRASQRLDIKLKKKSKNRAERIAITATAHLILVWIASDREVNEIFWLDLVFGVCSLPLDSVPPLSCLSFAHNIFDYLHKQKLSLLSMVTAWWQTDDDEWFDSQPQIDIISDLSFPLLLLLLFVGFAKLNT